MASCHNSLAKYNRLSPRYDRASWSVAWSITKACAESQLRLTDLKRLTFDQALNTINLTKSPGWPYTLRYQTKADYYSTPESRIDVKDFDESLATEHPLAPIETVFLKRELRAAAKCTPGQARAVFIQSPVCLMWSAMHTKSVDLAFIQRASLGMEVGHYSAVGLTPFFGNFDRMVHLYRNYDAYEMDASSFDACMFPEVHESIATLRSDLMRHPPSVRIKMRRYYRNLSRSFVILPDGTISFRASGNPSGQGGTTVDNTAGSATYVHYVLHRMGFAAAEIAKFKLFVFGDDVLLLVPPEFKARFDPHKFAILAHDELGVVYSVTPRGSSITQCKWLNFSFARIGSTWWPCLDPIKMCSSLHYRTGPDTIGEVWLRAASIRNLARGNAQLFLYLDEYCKWLWAQYKSQLQHLSTNYLTESQLLLLFHGVQITGDSAIERVRLLTHGGDDAIVLQCREAPPWPPQKTRTTTDPRRWLDKLSPLALEGFPNKEDEAILDEINRELLWNNPKHSAASRWLTNNIIRPAHAAFDFMDRRRNRNSAASVASSLRYQARVRKAGGAYVDPPSKPAPRAPVRAVPRVKLEAKRPRKQGVLQPPRRAPRAHLPDTPPVVVRAPPRSDPMSVALRAPDSKRAPRAPVPVGVNYLHDTPTYKAPTSGLATRVSENGRDFLGNVVITSLTEGTILARYVINPRALRSEALRREAGNFENYTFTNLFVSFTTSEGTADTGRLLGGFDMDSADDLVPGISAVSTLFTHKGADTTQLWASCTWKMPKASPGRFYIDDTKATSPADQRLADEAVFYLVLSVPPRNVPVGSTIGQLYINYTITMYNRALHPYFPGAGDVYAVPEPLTVSAGGQNILRTTGPFYPKPENGRVAPSSRVATIVLDAANAGYFLLPPGKWIFRLSWSGITATAGSTNRIFIGSASGYYNKVTGLVDNVVGGPSNRARIFYRGHDTEPLDDAGNIGPTIPGYLTATWIIPDTNATLGPTVVGVNISTIGPDATLSGLRLDLIPAFSSDYEEVWHDANSNSVSMRTLRSARRKLAAALAQPDSSDEDDEVKVPPVRVTAKGVRSHA